MAALLKKLAAYVIVLLALTNGSSAFMSQFKANFTYECPKNHALQTVEGIDNRYQSDRLFHFDCFSVDEVPITNCQWKDDVNQIRHDVIFKCGGDQVIAGVASKWIERQRDRIWSYRCCNLGSNYVIHSCDFTGWVNQYDKLLSYNVPTGHLISGVWSTFDSHYNDRQHQFDVCKVAQTMAVVG